MRFVFVYPNISTGNGLHYNHGLGQLSAMLKATGHETELLYLEEMPEEPAFVEDMKRRSPDAVAFSFGSHQWKNVRSLSDWLKREMDIPILAGGVHATHAPEETIAHPSIDFVCRGESEQAIAEWADAMENGRSPEAIHNFWMKDERGAVIRNDVRPLVEDLDSLPFSDRDLFDMDAVLATNAYEMAIMAGRGCPYGCYYCCNNALIKLYKGKGRYVRFRTVDHVLNEIEQLASRYRIDTLYFEDDIFTLKKPWVSEFAEKYKARFDFPFRIYLHVDSIDLDTLKMLKDVGLYMVNVGVESGNETIRREAMNRRMTNDRIVKVFGWLRDLDIIVRDFNIVGLPGESVDTMRETMELNERIMPDQVQVSIFYPYHGTRLYDRCLEAGYLSGEERQTYFEEETILNLPDLPREKIREAYLEFCDRARAMEVRKFHEDLKRGKAGYYDFLDRLDQMKLEYGDPEMNRADRFLIQGSRRFVLFSHPRSKIVYEEVPVRDGAKLLFGMALDPKCLTWGGGAICYRVFVDDGSEEHEVFQETIDPKGDPAMRKWHDREVDLSTYSGQKLRISFLTDPGEGGDLTGAWAGWSRPHLVVDGEGA